MSIPNSLLYLSQRLSDYETLPVQIFPDNAGTDGFANNQTITFRLPANSLINCETLYCDFEAYIDEIAGADSLRFDEDIHSLIRRVELRCGGDTLGEATDEWFRLKKGRDKLVGKVPHSCSHPRILRNFTSPTDSVSATEPIENSSNMDGFRFIWDDFGGFLSECLPRVIDFSVLPQCELVIHLGGKGVVLAGGATTTPTTFTSAISADSAASEWNFIVKSPVLHCECISFGNGSYEQYISSVLTKGLVIPFKSYRYQRYGNFTNTADFTATGRSIDRIHWQVVTRASTEVNPLNQIKAVPGSNSIYMPEERYYSSSTESAFGIGTTPKKSTFNLSLNGALVPSAPQGLSAWMKMSTDAVSESRNPWDAKIGVAEWAKSAAHCVYRLNRPGSTVQSSSGVNSLNTSIDSQLLVYPGEGDDASKNAVLHLWIESTRLLKVSPDRRIQQFV